MKTALTVAMVAGLCRVAAAQLYGVDIINANRLVTIDRDTAQVTLIGAVGEASPINGLAYDPNLDILYGVVPAPGKQGGLHKINRASGVSTLIGPLGGPYSNVNGLAFDPVDNILYATDNTTNSLLTLDTGTGAATLVAKITGGFSEVEGLGYDPVGRILYGLADLQNRIVKIDVTTAVATGVGAQLPGQIWRGLEYDPERKTLFATAGQQLFTINQFSGIATPVGIMQGIGTVQGLAVAPACYPDCDGSGELDIDDFLCFQTRFAFGEMSADCDASGELDIDDFVCFQTKFGFGCGK